MLLEDVNQLLKPGYHDLETGYRRLSNGQFHIAVLTPIQDCKGKVLDWYFNNYLRNPRQYLGPRKNFGKYLVEGKLLKYRQKHEDPSLYFDISKFKEAGVTFVTCLKSYASDGSLYAQIIHLARDMEYGCELRSRFWHFGATDESVQVLLHHYISDMSTLAHSLKSMVQDFGGMNREIRITCKYCNSDDVIKNGIRKGTQYWLCKKCRRGFVNNQALPKMKYSFDIVAKAVFDYCSGKSLESICRDINRENNLYPADSTILRWIRKLNSEASFEDINARPQSHIND